MLHLQISPEDNPTFLQISLYSYLNWKQTVSATDWHAHSGQMTIHKILTLDIPHGNDSDCYDSNTKYLGITKDATMAVELSTTQFWVCWEANSQFCSITTPFQPLANPPSCIAALYAKSTADITSKCSLQIWKASNTNLPTQIAPDVWILTTPLAAPANTMTLICPEKTMETIIKQKPVHILKLPMACSATSPNFYLPPRYEIGNKRSDVQLQHLKTIPLIPVQKIYQHLLNNTLPIMPFDIDKESTEHTGSIWTLFSHLWIYVTAIGLLIPAGLGLFCCYFFWCRPARLACWPLQPGNTQYTILDDGVEVAPIYRHDGKDSQPTIPCENHGLAIKHLPTWPESQCKQQSKSLVVPVQGSLEKSSQSRGHQNVHNFYCKT